MSDPGCFPPPKVSEAAGPSMPALLPPAACQFWGRCPQPCQGLSTRVRYRQCQCSRAGAGPGGCFFAAPLLLYPWCLSTAPAQLQHDGGPGELPPCFQPMFVSVRPRLLPQLQHHNRGPWGVAAGCFLLCCPRPRRPRGSVWFPQQFPSSHPSWGARCHRAMCHHVPPRRRHSGNNRGEGEERIRVGSESWWGRNALGCTEILRHRGHGAGPASCSTTGAWGRGTELLAGAERLDLPSAGAVCPAPQQQPGLSCSSSAPASGCCCCPCPCHGCSLHGAGDVLWLHREVLSSTRLPSVAPAQSEPVPAPCPLLPAPCTLHPAPCSQARCVPTTVAINVLL